MLLYRQNNVTTICRQHYQVIQDRLDGSIMVQSGDKTKLLNIRVVKGSLSETKIFKVEGTDDSSEVVMVRMLTTFLTNESHTLAAFDGNQYKTFTGAETDMVVFEGVTFYFKLWIYGTGGGNF